MILFGFHSVLDTLEKTGFLDGDKLIIARQGADQRLQRVLSKAERARVHIIRKNYGDLNAIAGSKNHQGIILERSAELPLKTFTKQDFVAAQGGIYLALDGIEDPQNLGAIVRSAVGLNAAGIFLPQKHSAPTGATAMKASAGTLIEMPFCFTGSIAQLMQFIHDKNAEIPMIALDKTGELFSEADLDFCKGENPTLLVIGAESGISRLALERATHRRRLRMSEALESYNVSVATALALYSLTT
ncbi:MAG TPA: RNA methyltransferase [Turneriella sp.]|nr:RNA methyltransferase [Turneriella sp.]